MPPRKKTGILNRKRGATNSSSENDECQGLNCIFHQLPDALIKDIFSRLCVKTILICRRVCKSWLFLTSDSQFARLHQSISSSTTSGIGISLGHIQNANKLDFYNIEEELSELKTWSIRFNLAKTLAIRDFSELQLRNSCNGFLCLSGGAAQSWAIYICNPMLCECIRIPPSNFNCQDTSAVSLGFCHRTNEYKVLKTTYEDSRLNYWNGSALNVEIYTVGTRVWRSIRNVPRYMSVPVNSLTNGAPHWRSYGLDDITIWSFDFGSEQFRALATPSKNDGFQRSRRWNLGDLQGCLTLYSFDHDGFEIWIMKEYGVQNSWTKILVFAYIDFCYHSCQPFMRLSSGEILMIFGTENRHPPSPTQEHQARQAVVRYVPAEKRFVDAGIIRTPSRFKAIAYSLCFVSLNDISKGARFEAIGYSPCFVSLNDISKGGEEVRRVRKSRKYERLLAGGSKDHDGCGNTFSQIQKTVHRLLKKSGLANKATNSSEFAN